MCRHFSQTELTTRYIVLCCCCCFFLVLVCMLGPRPPCTCTSLLLPACLQSAFCLRLHMLILLNCFFLFVLQAAFSKMPEWADELAKAAEDKGKQQSEADEYGIDHFSVRELGRPFHPERWYVLHTRSDVCVLSIVAALNVSPKGRPRQHFRFESLGVFFWRQCRSSISCSRRTHTHANTQVRRDTEFQAVQRGDTSQGLLLDCR